MMHSTMTRLVLVLALAGFAVYAQDAVAPVEPVAAPPADVKIVPNEVPMHRDPVRQLGRGLSNVGFGVLEVPFCMYNVSKEDGDIAGATYGTVLGLQRFLTREFVGLFEVVTFPAGWAPIIEPEFPFQPMPSTDWEVRGIRYSND